MDQKRKRVVAVTFLAAAFVVTGGFAVQGHARAAQYRRLLDTGYRHAFTELTTAAGELDVALRKVSFATTPELFSSLCAQAYAKALAAQSALGELPYGNVELEQTASFLAKAGDFAMALARGTDDGQACSQEERDTLQALAATAADLSGLLNQLQTELDGGTLEPEDLAAVQARLAQGAEEAPLAGSAFQTVEADFPQAPSLIYDGPFSEHLSNRTPKMLDGLPQITQEEARQAAARFLELEPQLLTDAAETEGALPTWGFSAPVDGGELWVEVTKQGGQILRVLSSRPVGQPALTRAQGTQRAAEFLASKGFQDMAPSYSIEQDGLLTVHFAPVTDGIYCYPDLVKVGIALDTGDMVNFEAEGYLMNHGARTLDTPAVDRETAQAQVSSSLQVLAHQLALIPTDGEYEVLCHEFKCQAQDGGHVLVYVNAADGSQERILLLLEDASGTLVI